MDAEQFEVLSKKMDAIIALLAVDKLVDKSKTDSILLLNQFGLDYSTIASIVGTSPKAVAARVSDAKKAKVNKDGKKEKVIHTPTVEVSENNGGEVVEESLQ